jgi:hypothetical protein
VRRRAWFVLALILAGIVCLAMVGMNEQSTW